MIELIPDKWGPIEDVPADVLKKALSSPLAEELAELYLLHEDLENSYNAMSLFFDRYVDSPPGHDDFTVRMSLFRDAIVQFAQCFSKDEPLKPRPEEVYANTQGWKPLYDIMSNLRNGYAAHNFSLHRQHGVCAVLEWNPSHDRVRLFSLCHEAGRFGGFAKADRDNILKLIEIARDFILQRGRSVRDKLWDELVATDPDELFKLPDYVSIDIPDLEHALTPRAFHRKGRPLQPKRVRKGRTPRKPE